MNENETTTVPSSDSGDTQAEITRRLKNLFNAMPNGTATYVVVRDGEDFVFTGFNPAAEAIEKISRDKVIGRSVREVFPAVEKFGLFAVFQDVHRTGELRNHPVSQYKDGRVNGWRENIVFPIGENEIATIYRDATSEKMAEEALRLSEEKYRAIFSCSSDAIFVHDATTGRLLEVNEAMLRMFGCTYDEAMTTDPNDFSEGTSPNSSADSVSWIAKARDTGKESFEWRSRRKDGTLFWTEVNLTYTEIGGAGRVIAVVRDLTEKKKQQELSYHVQQVQKLESLGVLAGGIAHDFNNILMTILGNTELALFELSPLSPARNNLQDIESSSRKAADLCRQLLAYSGKGRFVNEQVDLSELIGEMTNMLQMSIAKKTTLKLDLAEDLPPMVADPTQIRQVLMNLVINGSEALENSDGLVSISTGAMQCDPGYLDSLDFAADSEPGVYCYFEVTDNGCGMDKEPLSRIFEPFYTTKFTGRGLGMAAVLGIVRGHRGALKVHSEPGKGTTFKILFPTTNIGELPPRTANGENRDWTGTGRILLVDDEPGVLQVTSSMLKKLGFEVLTASNGKEALEIYRREQAEITGVIMDLTMPQMDGTEAFRELRRINDDVIVILASGYNQQELSQAELGKGLAGFLQKPYQMSALRLILKKALAAEE